ncbi:glutathione S-transferase family protein [Hoeflea sp. WL0058]|uniref:Glutathione S-transferase family protein n=1 Tax=Flavimaribacter sediminis TaxID=2865987 RepID=A0AAE3D046_9HYPH|nr:glutathione S-transferase family protein [Flavimaribacter sediminis]MBW8636622.1 glutathione S-transferase family protein [Flavimaribacter sediminis]
MKLLGQPHSINVRKVLWTCVELGIAPDREDWGGNTRSTSSPEFLAINPKGLVPVLVDGDVRLSESNTICRYLAAREGRSDLLPESAAERAEVEAWMDWQLSELNNAWRSAFMGLVRKHPAFGDADAQAASIQAWNSAMHLLDRRLASTDAYICGEKFTLTGIVLALSTNRWENTPMDRPQLPAVSAWMDRMSKRPGFAEHCRNGIA